jgi:hypothetical protein
MADELDALIANAVGAQQNGQTPPVNPAAPTAPQPPDPSGATTTGFMNFLAGGGGTGSIGSVNPNASLWTNDALAYWGLPLSGGVEPGLASQRDVAMAARDEKPLDRMSTVYRPGAPMQQGVTAKAILESLVRMSQAERALVQSKLVAAGFLKEKSYSPGAADDQTINAMAGMLGEAARFALTRGEVISWQQYLSDRAVGGDGSGDVVEKAKDGTTSQSMQATLLTVEGVRGSFTATFRDMIGREPTPEEIQNFVDAYNAEVRANPPKRIGEMGDDGTEFVTIEGTTDPAAFAEEHIQENPDYAQYQAVATYVPALEELLGAVGGLGSGQVEL